MSLDLVTYMYETVWFHFHAIVKSLLIDENTDMRVQFSALVTYHTIPYIHTLHNSNYRTCIHTYIHTGYLVLLADVIDLSEHEDRELHPGEPAATVQRNMLEEQNQPVRASFFVCVCVCVCACVCMYVCMFVCNIQIYFTFCVRMCNLMDGYIMWVLHVMYVMYICMYA